MSREKYLIVTLSDGEEPPDSRQNPPLRKEIMHTEHKKILMVKNTRLDMAKFKEDVQQMEKAISLGEPERIQETLSRMCTCHLSGTRAENGLNEE